MAQETADNRKTPTRLVGYARLSSAGDQAKDRQAEDLRAAGCDRIYQEHGSDASQARPVLVRLLADLNAGDVLVVTRLDRVARSANDLLALLEKLRDRNIGFRSLGDPVDTTGPLWAFSIEFLRAIVDLEKAQSAERARESIKAAKAQGRLPGNPGLRERHPEAIEAASKAREKLYIDGLKASSETWLPVVRQLRPKHSWDNVVDVLNRRGQDWTVERLRRAVNRLVREQLAGKELLDRSPRRAPEDHLMKKVAAITIADPSLSLRDIASELEKMGERPARGGKKFQPSSVRDLLDQAHRFGLIRR
ncbi:recombinase family protein [Rhizobium sp. Rhizsp42]|uniref:recombinase family protein n=1 Tax=Rhizobium sp. Rhizsp42 TaxID=3243034 RepID=UPI000DD57E60